MTRLADINQTLSLATLVLAQVAVNRVGMVKGMEAMHEPSRMDFHSPRLTKLLNVQLA